MGTLSVDKLVKTSTGAAEFTLPATDGTAGQVWQTDGSGQISVATVPTTGIADLAVTNAKMADDAVGVAELSATGTASATTFLRGDNAWQSAGLSGWSEDGADNDLLPASANAGIYLGVNSATAANLLDDYETGTWTCTFSNADAQTGYYVKVGNLCHVSARITTSGGASGTTFGGLPFTSAASDNYRSSGGVGYQNSTSAGSGLGIWNPLTGSSSTNFNFFVGDATQEMGSTGRTTYFSITYPTS